MLGRVARRVGTGLGRCGHLGDSLRLEAARRGRGAQPRPVRLRDKPTGEVWMRNGTSDHPTLVSCFVKGLHRPLRPLPERPTILDIGANADAFSVGSGGATQRSVESLTMGTLLDRCGFDAAKDSRHWDTVVAWRGGSGTAGL